jgi:hypothetical protein
MAGHVLRDEPGYRDVMRMHAFECRVPSRSLPGVSVGDLVDIEVAEEDYTFWKPDGVRLATLPIGGTEEEKDDTTGWVSLRNSTAGISVWLSPSDTFITGCLASTGTLRSTVRSSAS